MNRQQRRTAVKSVIKSTTRPTRHLSDFDVAAHLFKAGQMLQAEATCRAILANRVGDIHRIRRLGQVAQHFKRNEVAADLFRRAISLKPSDVDLYADLAASLKDLGRLNEAIEICRNGIAIEPNSATIHNALGRVLHDQNLLQETAEAYQRAISLDPRCVAAHVNLGMLSFGQGKIDAAYASFQEAIRIKPDFVEAHRRYAHVLRQQGRLNEAAACLQRALVESPLEYLYYADLAIVYMHQGRHSDAIESCKKALELNSEDAGTLANLGNSLHDIGQWEDAISAYKFAIRIDPNIPTFFSNLGNVYGTAGRAQEAIDAFRGALALDPHSMKALTGLYQQRRAICDWSGLKGDEATILERLRGGVNLDRVAPFAVLSMPAASPTDQLRAASLWAAPFVPTTQTPLLSSRGQAAKRAQRPIRVGYLSADYFNHATAFLITELIEKHDRSRFEVIGYSYGPDDNSHIRKRLVNAFDRFVDLRAAAHAEAAQRIREDEIDILVDLKGYTRDARTEILAFRPAPLQVNYLGYPGTMGVDFVDYVIGDRTVTPLADQPYYSEKIVQLPHSYQPNDTKRQIAERAPTRAECELPEQAFVFCCFNNSYKITPDVFDVWMRLLSAVPNSVLWLLEVNNSVKDNLRREAQSRGIDPGRLVFAPKLTVSDHLARHCHADLFLDTLPYNAHTTTSDALWAGLPVITCVGKTFAGRVAASLLNAVGLPELVTSSLDEYAALALQLATDPLALAEIKRKLWLHRSTTPLFDIDRYARDLERAYIHMMDVLEAGGSPEPIVVADL